MVGSGACCAFCGSSSCLVPISVLDEKWCRRFGGEPAVSLDHGWYTTARGDRKSADHVDPGKFFAPRVRELCDFCVHGWVEDVRWRAEPALLNVAHGRQDRFSVDELPALRRWASLTAMLAEMVEGLPRAASEAQRAAVRTGDSGAPRVDSWFFAVRQALPARVHLSQVPVRGEVVHTTSLVQVVSVDLAHLSVLVVLPSDAEALDVVDRSGVSGSLGRPGVKTTGDPGLGRPLDLSRTPHPHQVALQRLCSTSTAAVSPG